MKKVVFFGLFVICAPVLNAQIKDLYVDYTPVYVEPQRQQQQQQQRQQFQFLQPQQQRNREVRNITAYRYINSGWQKVTLQLTIDGNHEYISGYRDKATGYMYDGFAAPISEVSQYNDGEVIYNNFDFKANVPSLGTCYF